MKYFLNRIFSVWGILVVIFLVGIFLRFYQLSSIPVGLHGDEASIGYNAYSLLKTGRDVNNQLFPIVIDQWGDFRPAGYHYLTIPFVAIFSLNEFAVRFPSALFGSLTIIVMFLFLKTLVKRNDVALIGALVTAISPWHIVVSRATSEGVISFFLVLLGSYIIIPVFRQKNFLARRLVIGYTLFFISQLFYHSARFFVPSYVLLLTLFLVFRYRVERFLCFKILTFSTILLSVTVFLFYMSSGTVRVTTVSIFSNHGTQLILDEQIREDQFQPVVITKFFHNKVTSYTETFLQNYFEYFSGRYLFLSGGYPHRYVVPHSGMMYSVDILALFVGGMFMVYTILWKKNYLMALPLLWLFIGPAVGALTYEDIPNVQRSLFMLGGLIPTTACGYSVLVQKLRNNKIHRYFLGIIGIVLTYQIVLFMHNYFHHTFMHETIYRSVSARQLTTALDQLSERTKPIIMTADGDNVPIFYLFYWHIDPAYYHSLGFKSASNLKNLLNITFDTNPCPYNSHSTVLYDVLYVNRAFCEIPIESRIIQKIDRPDGSNDYVILEAIKK